MRARSFAEPDGALAAAKGPHPYWGGEPHALHVAAECGRAEVVRALLAHGADPNVDSRDYPLHCAARNGHIEVARILLEYGAEKTALDDPHQATAANWAEFQGHPEVAASLRR